MLMMEACTSKACGQLISYETLETLGDAFLKFATSAHLYQNLPKAHEGTSSRQQTQVLSECTALHLDVSRYIVLQTGHQSVWQSDNLIERSSAAACVNNSVKIPDSCIGCKAKLVSKDQCE